MGCLCPSNSDATTMKFEPKHVRNSQNDQLVSQSMNSQSKSKNIGSQIPIAAPSGPYNRHPDEVQTNHSTQLEQTENLLSEEQKQNNLIADPYGRHMSRMYGDRYSMVKDRQGTFAGSVSSGKKIGALETA